MKTATILNDRGDNTFFVMTSLGFTTFATSDIPLVPGDKVEIKLHGPQGDDATVIRKL